MYNEKFGTSNCLLLLIELQNYICKRRTEIKVMFYYKRVMI